MAASVAALSRGIRLKNWLIRSHYCVCVCVCVACSVSSAAVPRSHTYNQMRGLYLNPCTHIYYYNYYYYYYYYYYLGKRQSQLSA